MKLQSYFFQSNSTQSLGDLNKAYKKTKDSKQSSQSSNILFTPSTQRSPLVSEFNAWICKPKTDTHIPLNQPTIPISRPSRKSTYTHLYQTPRTVKALQNSQTTMMTKSAHNFNLIDVEEDAFTKLTRLQENLQLATKQLTQLGQKPQKQSRPQNSIKTFIHQRKINDTIQSLLLTSEATLGEFVKVEPKEDTPKSSKSGQAQLESRIEQMYHDLNLETSQKVQTKSQLEQMIKSQQINLRQLKIKEMMLRLSTQR